MSRSPFVDSVQSAIERQGMVVAGQTVVVAVSGGPDSTALLHSLWTLRDELKIGLVVATMEHGIRGDESEADAEHVANLCAQLDIPCHIEHRDIPAIAKKRRVSTSVAARDERHDFLRQVSGECCVPGAERIALGHTSDDRAETILMNILRGAGSDGLCAMPPVQLPIIRPILGCTRAQAGDYCAEMNLHPRIDSSNANIDYPRNRIRTELLPYLATYYNTGVRDALVRLAEISEDDREVLEGHAASLLRKGTIESRTGEFLIDASILRAAPMALQRRAVRLAVGTVRGELTDVGFSFVESILAAVNGFPVKEQTLPRAQGDQIHIRVSGNTLRIWSAPAAAGSDPWQVTLVVPGEIDLPYGDWRVSANIVAARTALKDSAEFGVGVTDQPASICCFRRRDLSDALTIRSWRPGDKMHPKGMSGTKKLQDLYTDCKVPRPERNLVPVVELSCKGGAIVAALGVRSSNLSLNCDELREIAAHEPDEQITVLRLVSAVRNVGS